MTSVGLAKRMAKYPNDSLMLGACPVDVELVAVAETALLKAAKQRFRQRCLEGRESFEGDIDNQVALLYEIGKRFKPELRLPIASSSSDDDSDDAHDNDDAHVASNRPTDLVARVHAFKAEVCDHEYVDSVVPLLDVHARYTEWLGVAKRQPINVRRLCAELRRNFGIRPHPSPLGAMVNFGVQLPQATLELLHQQATPERLHAQPCDPTVAMTRSKCITAFPATNIDGFPAYF
jgi:hypothetical protein